MITAIFMVYFLETNTVQFIADQATFPTMEECNQYAEQAKALQQKKVEEGSSDPHVATHKCVNWGEGI